MPDNKNLLLAIVLSVGVLLAWQFFIAGPEMERLQQQTAQQQQVQPVDTAQPATDGIAVAPSVEQPAGALPSGEAETGTLARDEALARSPRIEIATPALSGSINLAGGRIDDLHLNEFRETVEPDSPTITLLSPSGGPDAYFAEFGWIGSEGSGPLPDSATVWTAPADARLTIETPLTLTFDNGAGLLFERTIAVDEHYMFTVTDKVTNSGSAAATLSPFGRITRVGEPVVAGYWILHEGMIGVTDSLQEVSYGSLRDDGQLSWDNVVNGWIGITDKYWATTLIPDRTEPFTGRFVFAEGTDPVYQADFRGEAQSIAPGATIEETSLLFAGAKQVAVVDGYQAQYDIKLFDRLIDWGWFWYFTKPLFYLIDWFYRLLGNFGLAILAVTVVVKAFFFPLANKSYKSMSAMKKVQPQMMDLRERYKDDKAKQQQALMELYKKEKINPLAGCWPIAVQIPVFFALYKVLFVTIEMRHAPFFGWIQDLAAPDPTTVFNLFGLLPFDPSVVPIIGAFLMLGAWPIIMGITMFVQMRLNPTPPDPAQAMIFTWMPVIFTFFLAGFPAGLVIYWAWNNTLSVTQQYFIMRRYGTEVNLWGNILESIGLREKKPQPAPALAAPAAAPKPANDDTPAADEAEAPEKAAPVNGSRKKKKKQKAKG
jgi:YidC/Oxa1 family membrane protein insertase